MRALHNADASHHPTRPRDATGIEDGFDHHSEMKRSSRKISKRKAKAEGRPPERDVMLGQPGSTYGTEILEVITYVIFF